MSIFRRVGALIAVLVSAAALIGVVRLLAPATAGPSGAPPGWPVS